MKDSRRSLSACLVLVAALLPAQTGVGNANSRYFALPTGNWCERIA